MELLPVCSSWSITSRTFKFIWRFEFLSFSFFAVPCVGFVRTCALKKNCDADPMARLFVACTKAAHVPEFDPPSMTTAKVFMKRQMSLRTASIISCLWSTRTSLPSRTRGYPCVCGEYSARLIPLCRAMGSPPRVRGIGRQEAEEARDMRITPACAGNRNTPNNTPQNARDHPRVCGE